MIFILIWPSILLAAFSLLVQYVKYDFLKLTLLSYDYFSIFLGLIYLYFVYVFVLCGEEISYFPVLFSAVLLGLEQYLTHSRYSVMLIE